MSDFDYDKIRDMRYDPSRGRYIGDDGSELKVTMRSDGRGYKYDYYSSTTMNNAPHEGTHIKADLSGEWTMDSHNEDKSEWSHSSGSGCYLTTACMKHYMDEFDDNCYYLDILRWFRDNFVSLEDKKEYYDIAPKVVETLDKREDANIIYNEIYYKVIQVCVRLIEKGKYEEAYKLYKENVLDLQNTYVKKLVLN